MTNSFAYPPAMAWHWSFWATWKPPSAALWNCTASCAVYRVADINAARNVAGGGINMAQRVMDCGDAGHILISKSVADVLDQVSTWTTALHDLGEAEVKHGVRVHLYNLYTDEAGNRELPQKLRTAQTTAATARSQSKRKKWSLGVVVTGVIAALAVGGLLYYQHSRQWSNSPTKTRLFSPILPTALETRYSTTH